MPWTPKTIPRLRPAAARRHGAGFSLIELSIVIAIISIVAVLGLEMTAGYLSRTAYDVTAKRLDAIDDALVKYRRLYNRLPCPAPITMTPADACFGKEVNSPDTLCQSHTSNCNFNTMAGGLLRWGTVPVRDLGLPVSMMVDGYGSRIVYVVTTDLVYDESITPGVTTDNFTNGADAIDIRSGKLDATCGGASDRCQNRGKASYVLLSLGRDRGGSYGANGVAAVSCFTRPGEIDTANCRFGNVTALTKGGVAISPSIPTTVFYDSRINAGTQEESYFDDLIKWRSKGSF